MKRFVVIGLGMFGSSVARSLYNEGAEVIAVDLDPERVDVISRYVTAAAVGDGRQMEVLDRLGARDADAAIVSTGDDIGSSILATMALRDLGVGEIFAKIISRDHGRVMNRLGVTETIFPEQESGQNLAARLLHSDVLLNYIHLSKDFSIQEIAVPNAWRGKSLRELALRTRYRVQVVAVHDVLTDNLNLVPDPDALLKDSDTLLLAGADDNLERVAKLD